METQEQLDKWIYACLNHYNLKSNIKMKTTEERFQQLELAHARLYNQYQNLIEDFDNLKEQLDERFSDLKSFIVASSTEEVVELPETLIHNKDYTGVISAVLKSTPTKWNNNDWTNWEVKLEGKDDYAYIAFIPSEHILAAGDKVRFQYVHPFQLKKLKQL
jgi:hypothetical protein